MAGNLVLGGFASALLVCVITGRSVLYALLLGLALFFLYGLLQRHHAKELCRAALAGIAEVRTVLLTLALTGALSALWRACGTIPFLVTCASGFLKPDRLLLPAFLLCCLVSFLTGTSFGTAATAGVICMTMARSAGISPVLMGGVVLSGSYFGDRCSPVSTSALLISSLTKTDLYVNLQNMLQTAFVPFLCSCLVYTALGTAGSSARPMPNFSALFERFRLSPLLLLPAAAILLCSLLRLNVKWAMLASIALSAILASAVQGVAPEALLSIILTGYHPEDAALSSVLQGGGILSMARVLGIVCLSSAYSGLFEITGLLTWLRQSIRLLGDKIGWCGSTLAAACCMASLACNQTLAILLTFQLCRGTERNSISLAADLENSVVVVAPLVPWSIAAAVPLASISAPLSSIGAACFLYLVPIWHLLTRSGTWLCHRRPPVLRRQFKAAACLKKFTERKHPPT